MPPPNPYATALDGLDIPDPVATFFSFCQEREAIRQRRASGAKSPWSKDPIFQNARFLNVFREDDRVTKSLLAFVDRAVTAPSTRPPQPSSDAGRSTAADPTSSATAAPTVAADDADGLYTLVRSLFFARWCNRDSTLDQLRGAWADRFVRQSDPATAAELKRVLATDVAEPPWDNVTAYPVDPVRWEGSTHGRLDAATLLFARPGVIAFVVACVQRSGGDVIKSTAAINAVWKMDNDFPIFMAVMDIAWYCPQLVAPSSPVPVSQICCGIGLFRLLSSVFRLLSSVSCLLSSVFCFLSALGDRRLEHDGSAGSIRAAFEKEPSCAEGGGAGGGQGAEGGQRGGDTGGGGGSGDGGA